MRNPVQAVFYSASATGASIVESPPFEAWFAGFDPETPYLLGDPKFGIGVSQPFLSLRGEGPDEACAKMWLHSRILSDEVSASLSAIDTKGSLRSRELAIRAFIVVVKDIARRGQFPWPALKATHLVGGLDRISKALAEAVDDANIAALNFLDLNMPGPAKLDLVSIHRTTRKLLQAARKMHKELGLKSILVDGERPIRAIATLWRTVVGTGPSTGDEGPFHRACRELLPAFSDKNDLQINATYGLGKRLQRVLSTRMGRLLDNGS